MNDRDKKKVNTWDEKIWITQMQQRHGKDELTTLLVPNPNFGDKRKRKHRED